MSKQSILIYTEWYSILKDLPDEKLGQIFRAIFQKNNDEKIKLSSDLLIAFGFISAQIDMDKAKYFDKVTALKANASKGGVANASKRKQKLAKATKSYQIEPDNVDVNVNVNVDVNDYVYENEEEKEKEKEKGKRKVFVPPSADEVMNYCQERANRVNSVSFVNFYESKGWMVGKTKMKDWKACIRTWEERDRPKTEEKPNWLKEIEKQEGETINAEYEIKPY